MNTEPKKVLVIGGGIAGLTAAWELAQSGAQIELVEKADFLGGYGIQYACKATDECLQCGACSVESMLKNVVNEPNISVHLATEVNSIEKTDRFRVNLKKTAIEKSPEALDACKKAYDGNPSACAQVRGYSANNAKFYTADQTLNPETTGNADTLEIDAVVLATGFSSFDPNLKPTYRYTELENVVSGLDLEKGKRINGAVLRPSDGKAPEKVAFIQCVGSRDERLENLWCSKVCCPYALRTAQSMKYEIPDLDVTVFYMDIQNTGNNFPTFYEDCKSHMKFVRNIPVDMYMTEDGKIRTRFMDETESKAIEDTFDLVVLSVGIMPGEDNKALSELFGVALDADGFFADGDKLSQTITPQEGIFIAGTVAGPKTIADSMAHAGQAACEVMNYLGRA